MKETDFYVADMLLMVTKHILISLGCGNLKTGGFWVLGDSIMYPCPVCNPPWAYTYSHRWKQVVQSTMAILIIETYIYFHKHKAENILNQILI